MSKEKKGYPRNRKQTSEPPTENDIAELIQAHWGWETQRILPAMSRRVFYVQLPDRRVVFRANPGWDGPTEPSRIVRYIDHLSRCGAPVPQILPTLKGELSAVFRDYTISLESELEGDHTHRSRGFSAVGQDWPRSIWRRKRSLNVLGKNSQWAIMCAGVLSEQRGELWDRTSSRQSNACGNNWRMNVKRFWS